MLVCGDEALEQFVRDYSGSNFLALDMEADSLHNYKEKVCLLQCSDSKKHSLIDVLTIRNQNVLSSFISQNVFWMHGSDYDVRMFQRHYNATPVKVYDTQIAARLLGYSKFGYGDLVETCLGVKLEKVYQKADWSQRPLPEKMMHYAYDDVLYLKRLSEILLEELESKDRLNWFEESCHFWQEKAVEGAGVERGELWRVKGSGKMKREELHFLRRLWLWREREAESRNKPVFMICGNRQLLEWSEALASGRKVEGMTRLRGGRLTRLIEVVENARLISELEWPNLLKKKKRKYVEGFKKKCEMLSDLRDRKAKELGIDGSLILSRVQIENIANQESLPEQLLMNWQREVLEY